MTDFIVVLRNEAAVRAFGGRVHVSLGAGVSVAAGPVGRSLEADLRAGDGGTAACYTYSMSKGISSCCSFLSYCLGHFLWLSFFFFLCLMFP